MGSIFSSLFGFTAHMFTAKIYSCSSSRCTFQAAVFNKNVVVNQVYASSPAQHVKRAMLATSMAYLAYEH